MKKTLSLKSTYIYTLIAGSIASSAILMFLVIVFAVEIFGYHNQSFFISFVRFILQWEETAYEQYFFRTIMIAAQISWVGWFIELLKQVRLKKVSRPFLLLTLVELPTLFVVLVLATSY